MWTYIRAYIEACSDDVVWTPCEDTSNFRLYYLFSKAAGTLSKAICDWNR